MIGDWLKIWNDRFREKEYAYGIEPNEFLKEQLIKLPTGKILFGAEGEGRNAVYAAKLGWEVFAFDISVEGRLKALKLAKENNVSITYKVGDFPDLNFKDDSFDVISLIYAHFPPNIRNQYHNLLDQKLKIGGRIVFEAFGENHIQYKTMNPKVGGPSSKELLFSKAELKNDFKNYNIIELEESEVNLNEGLYHNGIGSVVRFIGQKE